MVYSNFTLETVRKNFQLESVQSLGIFSDIAPVCPRDHFISDLAKKVSVASAVNTEKARSELRDSNCTLIPQPTRSYSMTKSSVSSQAW